MRVVALADVDREKAVETFGRAGVPSDEVATDLAPDEARAATGSRSTTDSRWSRRPRTWSSR
jgi:hypothetical protein